MKTKWKKVMPTKSVFKNMLGQHIIKVEYMKKKDMQKYGFKQKPVVITLDNSYQIFALSDNEATDAGALQFHRSDIEQTITTKSYHDNTKRS
jgi:hypothetical protein